jgi:thymidine phosphorylase
METMAPVDLDTAMIRQVVEREGGCVVWGGAIKLSPADDILIRVERALDLDSEGQLIASVLSKKIAAGSTHLVIDLPVGPTAKVRSSRTADTLSQDLISVAETFGLQIKVLATDGLQPVGRGIGPALEARDVLSVLRCEPNAPQDLRQRATALAGALLELAGVAPADRGEALAIAALDEGRAWTKFQAICEAQGGMRVPPTSSHQHPLLAERSGRVFAIDNRRIARLAKLAGAPDDKAAGVDLHVSLGDAVVSGQPLCTVHAESPGELAYAFDYAGANRDIIAIREA